jgi:DNA-binding MarR family transcriptional regulator
MGDQTVFNLLPGPPSKDTAEELRGTASRLMALADRVEQGEPPTAWRKYNAVDPERNLAKIGRIAARVYANRRNRTNHLPVDLLGEPGWDILLDLVIQQSRSNTVSVTSAGIASGVPATTALRWIQQLEQEGLIERLPSSIDRRVQYLKLTQCGLKIMMECLLDGQAL